MINTKTLIALVNAAASGDTNQVYTVALQMAATMAREGNGFGARELHNAIDKARMKGALPPYSGPFANCKKCNANNGWEPEPFRIKAKYQREHEREFMERECVCCGFTWYERCNDSEGTE